MKPGPSSKSHTVCTIVTPSQLLSITALGMGAGEQTERRAERGGQFGGLLKRFKIKNKPFHYGWLPSSTSAELKCFRI